MCEHLADLEATCRWLHARDQDFLLHVPLGVLSVEKGPVSLLGTGDMKKQRLGWRKHGGRAELGGWRLPASTRSSPETKVSSWVSCLTFLA